MLINQRGKESLSHRVSLQCDFQANISEKAHCPSSIIPGISLPPPLPKHRGCKETCVSLGRVCPPVPLSIRSPSMSPDLVETEGPLFCLWDSWVSARTWGDFWSNDGVGQGCLGLEDEWFHQFHGGGGRWALGLAKHHILAKVL